MTFSARQKILDPIHSCKIHGQEKAARSGFVQSADYIITTEIELVLTEAGADVFGPCRTASEALPLSVR
jgi:hypothetical protein